MADIAAIARTLPDVAAGVACAGTKLESRTFRVGTKSFLFLSPTQLRLKLDASVAEAKKLGIGVGANGWTTLSLDALPSVAVLRRWIGESHALVAPSRTGSRATNPGAATKRAREAKPSKRRSSADRPR